MDKLMLSRENYTMCAALKGRDTLAQGVEAKLQALGFVSGRGGQAL